jgi:hypothetical protein
VSATATARDAPARTVTSRYRPAVVTDPAPGVPTASLLREARGAYQLAIRGALRTQGLSALPENSAYVLGGLRLGVPFDALVRQRRHAVERAGTVDALVAAGLLEPHVDGYVLTARGREVSESCAAASAALERHVVDQVGDDGLTAMRAGLVALIDWKERAESR